MVKTHITESAFCPQCKKHLDRSCGVAHPYSPRPNDFTICVYCKSWLVFNDDLSLRLAEDNDLKRLEKQDFTLMKEFTKRLDDAPI